jgi:hypothetical protein
MLPNTYGVRRYTSGRTNITKDTLTTLSLGSASKFKKSAKGKRELLRNGLFVLSSSP